MCFTAYYSLSHYTYNSHKWSRSRKLSLTHSHSHSLHCRLQKASSKPFAIVCFFCNMYSFCFYRVRFWLFSLSRSLYRCILIHCWFARWFIRRFSFVFFLFNFILQRRRIKFILLLYVLTIVFGLFALCYGIFFSRIFFLLRCSYHQEDIPPVTV